MECHQTAPPVDSQMEGGYIAEADQGLWVTGNGVIVQQRRNLPRRTPAPDAPDRFDGGIGKCLVDIPGFDGRRCGGIAAVRTGPAGRPDPDLKAQGLHRLRNDLNRLSLCQRGRRTHQSY